MAIQGSRERTGSGIASTSHTIWLLAVFATLIVAGAEFQRSGAPSLPTHVRAGMLPTYLALIAMEWGLCLYIRRGLRHRGSSLRTLIGRRGNSTRAVLRDLAQGVATWAGLTLVLLGLARLWGGARPGSIEAMLPRGPLESLIWVILSASAGSCEELTFRGYLQRQFAAWTGSARAGLVLQALLFGLVHGYQGVAACLRIACFGLVCGIVARGTNSLRPVIVAHALTDVVSGLLRS